MGRTNRRAYMEFIIVAIILLYCEYFFFRNIIETGTGALIGDRGDGRLTTLLTEHWWNFFNGKERFSEIAMFYPAEGVFGYTDLFLGYGLVYSIFRFVGLNMFISYKYTLIVVHAMGTVSMYYLMNKKLKCDIYWSLFGTMAFCFSDTYARHIGHTQLNAVSMLPVLLILFLGFLDKYENRKKRNIYAYLFITWFVLLTYNSWYIACFTGIFCFVFLIVYFIRLKTYNIGVFSALKEKILYLGKDLIGYAIFIVALYIPFVKIYLPVLKSSSGYSYGTCASFLPEFVDIFNVSESNLMVGKFIEKMKLSSRNYSSEVIMGFSIVLIGLFLTVFIYSRKKRLTSVDNNIGETIFIKVVPDVTFISILICIALMVRLSSNGVSLWIAVYYLFPIAKSVRAVGRFLLWLSFPIAVVTAYMANRYIKFGEQVKTAVVSGISVLIIFVSNINTIGVPSAWNYQEEYSFISKLAEPPMDAEVFYIIDTDDTKDPEYIYQLDAFEIATWYSIKTINGYSGQFPQNWWGIWDIGSRGYENSVFEWIENYSLKNVYAYDRATNKWIPSEERMLLAMDDVFYPAENKFSLSSGLEDWSQGEFVWTSQHFQTKIKNAKIKDTGLVIKMQTYFSNYIAQDAAIIPYLQIYVDKQLVHEFTVTDEYMEIKIPMPDHDNDVYDIEIKTNGYFNPKDIGINEDTRNLSIGMYYIGS